MTALILAVFAASLMGSLHCAGMCGAFVAFAVGFDDRSDHRRRAALQASYNTGRLLTYTILGGIAGMLGGAFNAAGQLMGFQRIAVIVAGGAMMIFGMAAILRLTGVNLPPPPVPGAMKTAAARAMRYAMDRPPLLRAFLTGLTTTLLPCGWLYAFVITSAGTGSAAMGMLTMAVFWSGTLPALVALGTGVQVIAARLPGLGRRIPLITALLVVVVGMFNVFDPGRLDGALRAAQPVPAKEALVTHVAALSDAPAPCCHDDARP